MKVSQLASAFDACRTAIEAEEARIKSEKKVARAEIEEARSRFVQEQSEALAKVKDERDQLEREKSAFEEEKERVRDIAKANLKALTPHKIQRPTGGANKRTMQDVLASGVRVGTRSKKQRPIDAAAATDKVLKKAAAKGGVCSKVSLCFFCRKGVCSKAALGFFCRKGCCRCAEQCSTKH